MEQNVLNTDLTGKVAVVTGASGTLCSIFAKALARAGAKVALLGRNMEKLKALADEIEAEGGIARGYTCNVMNKANCLQVAEDVMAELGPCDILVNGAGANSHIKTPERAMMPMPIPVQSQANRLDMSRRWAPTACPTSAMEASWMP